MTNVPPMAQHFICHESHVGNGVNTCWAPFYTFTHKNIVLQVWAELASHSQCQHTHTFRTCISSEFMQGLCGWLVLVLLLQL